MSDDDDDDWMAFDEEECGDYDFDDDDDDSICEDDDEHLHQDGGKSNNKSSSKKGKGANELYDIIGVARDATPQEIASKYRRQALMFHPDRNPDGAEQFKKLAAAYEVLSDATARRRYDRTGEVGDGGADFEDPDSARSFEISEMLRTFMEAFRESDEELDDLAKAFLAGRGALGEILTHFMWTNEPGEIARVVKLVNENIVPNLPTRPGVNPVAAGLAIETWKKSFVAQEKKLTKKYDKERDEAEKLLADFMEAQRKRNDPSSSSSHQKTTKTTTKTTKAIAAASGKKAANTAVADTNPANRQLMAPPSLLNMRDNARNAFSSMTDSLLERYGDKSKKAKAAKKETKKK